ALAAQARFVAEKLFPRHPKKYIWMTLLGERVGAELTDPRAPDVLSNHLPGPGLTIARSSWDADAVWTSFQAGPKIAVDHQHNDQGHFELWRGSDALLVDGGGPFAFATINHNTLLIDDGGRVLNYPPNQGVWARASRTVAFGDDGRAVVAVGDLGDAWAPKCALAGCSERAVTSAVRTMVYVRPATLVIDDRVEVDRDDVGVTWAAHVATNPTLGPGLASAVIGGSRVDVRTLLPAGVAATAPKEPTVKESHVYKKNDPRGDMWRLEVASVVGSRARSFLHWITADAAGQAPAAATAISGTGLRGGIGVRGGETVAVLFSETSAGGTAVVGTGAEVIVIAGLTPGESYAVSARGGDGGCAVSIAPGAGLTATSGGFVRVAAPGCTLKAN
ncbi:MAG TPA: heparinase II/III family protein, partial [Kofleriaceae bacterium]|nr:heparinase II/III family protein [Kofleriaceae bacterium]